MNIAGRNNAHQCRNAEWKLFLKANNKIPGMLTHFGNFLSSIEKRGVQNHFITMVRRPWAGLLLIKDSNKHRKH